MTEDNQSKECLSDIVDDDLIVGQVLESVVKSSSQKTETQAAANHTHVEHDEINPEDLDYDESSQDEEEHVELIQEVVDRIEAEHREEERKVVEKEEKEILEQKRREEDGQEPRQEEKEEEEGEEEEDEAEEESEVAMDTEEQVEERPQEQPPTPTESIDKEPEKEEIYVIEKFMDKKITSNGVVKYLVKWMNYPHKDNTWEPMYNLVDCEEAMVEFELDRAKKLAAKHKTNTTNQDETDTPKEYEINDIMNLIKIGGEKYFLISLANSTKKAFVRASLANRIFPTRVIDFYIKNMRFIPKKV